MNKLLISQAIFVLAACSESPEDSPPPTLDLRPELSDLPPVVDHVPLTPISGGTLAITPDGTQAIAGDPEGHRIFVVDLHGHTVRATLDVPGGEPGRVVTTDEVAFVALRTGGVVRIDLDRAALAQRFEPCAAPRGLALDGDDLHVACAGGELVTLRAHDGTERSRLFIEPDLRDVVVADNRLHVTTFRSAQVVVVQDGRVADRWQPRALRPEEGATKPSAPTVAWRTVGRPGGGLIMLHQRSQLSSVSTRSEGSYGGDDLGCASAVVQVAVTEFGPDGRILRDGVLRHGSLGVDIAPHKDGRLMVAAPGVPGLAAMSVAPFQGTETCIEVQDALLGERRPVTATAVAPDGTTWFLSRHPLALVGPRVIALGESREDTGHTLFHAGTSRGIACASCHPEGGDDGHTWLFEGVGLRRTQHLRGGLIGREPFHWEGDLRDMSALVEEVMVKRMGHPSISREHTERLLAWIDAQPTIRLPARVPDAVARGRAHFEALGCVGCHTDGTGDGRTYNVGTGGYFQVPNLQGLALRAPYMHDGCAPTLHDRFGPCGGDQHGATDTLDPTQIDDLVAYLETL